MKASKLKIQELRIGNHTSNGVVVNIFEDHFFTRLGDINFNSKYHEANPIPLTEEWLLNFGFEKCEGRHGEYFKHQELDAFRVWYNADLRSWSVGRKDYSSIDRDYNTYWIRDFVTTVHRLQNIFYCLTGEELTIKK